MSWLKNLMLGSDSRGKKGTDGPTPVAESDFKKTDSGLQYCDLKTGDGASPAVSVQSPCREGRGGVSGGSTE